MFQRSKLYSLNNFNIIDQYMVNVWTNEYCTLCDNGSYCLKMYWLSRINCLLNNGTKVLCIVLLFCELSHLKVIYFLSIRNKINVLIYSLMVRLRILQSVYTTAVDHVSHRDQISVEIMFMCTWLWCKPRTSNKREQLWLLFENVFICKMCTN